MEPVVLSGVQINLEPRPSSDRASGGAEPDGVRSWKARLVGWGREKLFSKRWTAFLKGEIEVSGTKPYFRRVAALAATSCLAYCSMSSFSLWPFLNCSCCDAFFFCALLHLCLLRRLNRWVVVVEMVLPRRFLRWRRERR